MKRIFLITFICFFSGLVQAAELAGVYVEDKIQSSNGDALVLNGAVLGIQTGAACIVVIYVVNVLIKGRAPKWTS